MRRTPGRSPLLARWVAMLVSMWVHEKGKSRSSGASIGGYCGEGGWVKSGGIDPFSWGGSSGFASLLARSVGLSS